MTIPVPAKLQPFVRILGTDGAIRFLLRFGGAELYLTTTPKGKSEVEKMCGPEKVALLADAFLPRRMPLGKEWIAQVWHSEGLSKAEIARRLNVTDVTVRTYLKKSGASSTKGSDKQLPLF